MECCEWALHSMACVATLACVPVPAARLGARVLAISLVCSAGTWMVWMRSAGRWWSWMQMQVRGSSPGYSAFGCSRI